jgi:hypothetical protein
MSTTTIAPDVERLKTRLKDIWMAGDASIWFRDVDYWTWAAALGSWP